MRSTPAADFMKQLFALLILLLAHTAPAAELNLREADSNRVVPVVVGDSVVITLAGNITTGYSWSLARLEIDAADAQKPSVKSVGDIAYQRAPAPPGLLGSGGMFVARFTAAAEGKAIVRLEYKRPFEKDKAAAKTFDVTLVVKPAKALPKKDGSDAPSTLVATYSIVAFDPATGDLGVAVQSKFFGVGSVVPWARAGVGAIATQAEANVTYGPDGLKLLAEGKSAKETLGALTAADARREFRQLGIVDAQGRVASFTGEKCHDWAGQIEGKQFAAQGNLLASESVVKGMAAAFEKARASAKGELADWLVAALDAAEAAGGDRRGRQSAALLVVREKGGYARANDRYVDLRVEDNVEPIKELGRLLEIHKQFYPNQHAAKPKRVVNDKRPDEK